MRSCFRCDIIYLTESTHDRGGSLPIYYIGREVRDMTEYDIVILAVDIVASLSSFGSFIIALLLYRSNKKSGKSRKK